MEHYKRKITFFSYIEMCKETLTFGDTETKKKKKFTAVKVPVF